MQVNYNAKPTLLVFIVKLELGGIETYFAKISSYLSNERNVVVFYLKGVPNESLIRIFDKRVKFYRATDLRRIIRYSFGPEGVDILSTGRNTLPIALFIKMLAGNVRLLLGIYSQYEMNSRSDGFFKFLYFYCFSKVGYRNTFFCTRGLRDIQSRLDSNYSQSRIVPLAVKYPVYCSYQHSNKLQVKVVSIGRFVDFKKYIYQIPKIAHQLKIRGLNVAFDIYGYGPFKSRLMDAIHEYSIADRVSVLDKVDPGNIPHILYHADLFMGSGSVLLEAASLGIPSIVCIDNNPEPSTPGFLHTLDLYYTSEERDNIMMSNISDLIYSYSTITPMGKQSICRASYEYCKPYYPDVVAANLINLFSNFQI